MAPIHRANLEDVTSVEDQVKDLIQGLFQLMVQVTQYDNTGGGRPSREVVANEIKSISASLQTIHRTSTSPDTRLPHVPQELIMYVENGRNPDIYTREFVELVRRGNQLMKGKMNAFSSFRDVLAGEMRAAMPELSSDVDRVLHATSVTTDASSSAVATQVTASTEKPAPSPGRQT